MIKVMHIITDLSTGGAELMMCRVLAKMDFAHFENEVVSLTTLGDIAGEIRAAGVPTRALSMKTGSPNAFPAIRLLQWIRSSNPQIIQTWMYHANLVGGLAAHFARSIPVVWGIHQANLEPEWNKPLTIWTAKTCARMSRWLPACIVFCSRAAFLLHTKLGYAADRMEIIANGFDLEEFRPQRAARLSLRKELELPEDVLIIGMAARFHPVKDHRNFILAAERLHAKFPGVHFALFGLGVTPANRELVQWIVEAGIQACCHLLGERKDTARLFSAVDIATSSSSSEAFPLSVGEAMACGTPCVVTDVGDSAFLVGETGGVVKAKNSHALAEAWGQLIDAGPGVRRRLGIAARRRVQLHFALPTAVERYESIYAQLADEKHQRTPSSGLAQHIN